MGISGASGNVYHFDLCSFLFVIFEIVLKIICLFFLFYPPPGRHPCLWCTILALEMKLAHDKRSLVQERTLQHLTETFQKFKTKANGDIKKAKDYFNVIHEPLLDIPLDQVIKDSKNKLHVRKESVF